MIRQTIIHTFVDYNILVSLIIMHNTYKYNDLLPIILNGSIACTESPPSFQTTSFSAQFEWSLDKI